MPTVWSNVLAALALSQALSLHSRVLVLALVFSVFYVGGMYLNDAFDRHIDKAQRPTRPIPSGAVSATTVFGIGFGALISATLLNALVARSNGGSVVLAAASGALLSAVIVCYDAYHKQNPLSPLVMGACRVLIYVAVAYAVSDTLLPPLLFGAACLWCYLIGLTYAAKQEALNRLTRIWPLAFLAAPITYAALVASRQPWVWPFLLVFVVWVSYALTFLRQGPRRFVPHAVVRLIAGISLLDAVLIASTGAVTWALVAVAACAATRLFQRVIPGT